MFLPYCLTYVNGKKELPEKYRKANYIESDKTEGEKYANIRIKK